RIPGVCMQYFTPYLIFHGPCVEPDIEINDKGRQWRRYRCYQTPLETLLAIPKPEQYLRSGVSVAMLRRIAHVISDTEAAGRMQQAKRTLFEELRRSA